MKAKDMFCDYRNRHPNIIALLSVDENDNNGFDTGREVYVSKIICMDDSPNYMYLEQMEMAAERDATYKEAIRALQKGEFVSPVKAHRAKYGNSLQWWAG